MSKKEKKAYRQGIMDTLLMIGISVVFAGLFVYGILM